MYPSAHPLRTALEAIRASFQGVVSRHDAAFCRWNIADDANQDKLGGQKDRKWSEESIIGATHLTLRHPQLRPVSSEEREQIAKQRPNATFIEADNGAGILLLEPGVSSTIHLRGDSASYAAFESLAQDAAFCLIGQLRQYPLTLKLPELVPLEAISGTRASSVSTDMPRNLMERWIAFLHILGWQNLPLSPLRAERKIWHDNASISGDPEKLHEYVGIRLFGNLLDKISLPPGFFASTLLSDINLASCFAIDTLLTGGLEPAAIDVERFRQSLAELQPGRGHASQFHALALDFLRVIFDPDLHSPVSEEKLHEGRSRIDIVFNNAAERGYFADLPFRHQIKCPVVFFECKNYSSDVGPQEFAQLITRFSDKRSKVGFIVCRQIDDQEQVRKRCRDCFQDRQEHILVLEDSDLIALLELKAKHDEAGISGYLHRKFRPVFMDT